MANLYLDQEASSSIQGYGGEVVLCCSVMVLNHEPAPSTVWKDASALFPYNRGVLQNRGVVPAVVMRDYQ